MANKHRHEIIQLVTTNPVKYSYQQVADIFGETYENVRNVARLNKIKHLFRKIDTTQTFTDVKEMDNNQVSYYKRLFTSHNLNFEDYPYLWDKETIKGMSLFLKNPEFEKKREIDLNKFISDITKAAPRPKLKPLKTGRLIIPANFDIHIGKHCEAIRSGYDYTPEKAVKSVLEGQEALYAMTSPFNVTDVLLPMGNDVVHVDNNGGNTTGGTHQDSYGSVESQILLAAQLYIKSIERFAERHNVWLTHIHSNHDRVSGWSVSQIVGAYFHNHPRVKWTNDSLSQQPRKYFIFGNNLIMFEHGEGKEEATVGQIMHDARQALSQTKHTYVYRGHLHHKSVSNRGLNPEKNLEKDYNAVTVIKSASNQENRVKVEIVRSPSAPDMWHSVSNYTNMPAVEMFVHDEHKGQLARFTHWF